MTELLERAFAEVAKLNNRDQDTVAAWILDELAAEGSWVTAFDGSADVLAQLADEALAEHHAGRTQRLDPERP